MSKKKQRVNNEGVKIAGKTYEPSDHEGTTQLEQGLAETQEQFEDNYMEGTVDQLLK